MNAVAVYETPNVRQWETGILSLDDYNIAMVDYQEMVEYNPWGMAFQQKFQMADSEAQILFVFAEFAAEL